MFINMIRTSPKSLRSQMISILFFVVFACFWFASMIIFSSIIPSNFLTQNRWNSPLEMVDCIDSSLSFRRVSHLQLDYVHSLPF